MVVFILEEEIACTFVNSTVAGEPGYPGAFDPFIRVGGDTAWEVDDEDDTYVQLGPNATTLSDAIFSFLTPVTPFDVHDTTKVFRLRCIAHSVIGVGRLGAILGEFNEFTWFASGITAPPGPDYVELVGELGGDQFGLCVEVMAGLGTSGPVHTGSFVGAVMQNLDDSGPGAPDGTAINVTYLGLQIGHNETDEPPDETVTRVAVTRQYPRDDNLGVLSAGRLYPPPKSQRTFGGYQ